MTIKKILIAINVILLIPISILVFNSMKTEDRAFPYVMLDNREPITYIDYGTAISAGAISLYTNDEQDYSALVYYLTASQTKVVFQVDRLDKVYTDFYSLDGKIYLKPAEEGEQYLVINSDVKTSIDVTSNVYDEVNDEIIEVITKTDIYELTYVDSIDENTYAHHNSVNYNNEYVCNVSTDIFSKCVAYHKLLKYTLTATMFAGDL